tara:strand:- start:598 stop:2412 length:1815 start_codon:yes stop_codon:yes gene_type:complete
MHRLGHLGIIGSGPTAVFLLKHIADNLEPLKHSVDSITVIERSSRLGCGMPYNPETTDTYSLSNISSEEIPELPQSLYHWLHSQEDTTLATWGIQRSGINRSEIYPRLALGAYFQEQYQILRNRLIGGGLKFFDKPEREVIDIEDLPESDGVGVHLRNNSSLTFDSVIISTGHSWATEEKDEGNLFRSPWPISKLIPKAGEYHNHTIGTLGASLSAFDVVASLAHRHGRFQTKGNRLVYLPHPGTDGFKVAMHSKSGWLPHLQFEQTEPMREIYRHIDRDGLLQLIDKNGFLTLSTYFDRVCRPALVDALRRNGLEDLADSVQRPDCRIEEFIEIMSEDHQYLDAFDGMREELVEAENLMREEKPLYWKEVIDDLIYTLNFHAELLPAEDHLFLNREILPFLLNIVAATPLPTGKLLLALHDAGKLELVAGKVSIAETPSRNGTILVTVGEEDGNKRSIEYAMFVDCSGQSKVEIEDFPFQTLVKQGAVRPARARILKMDDSVSGLADTGQDRILHEDGTVQLQTGGIDIDAAYRLIPKDGTPTSRIYDIAFPHALGVRPYSYGLQACDATAAILVNSWQTAIDQKRPVNGKVEEASINFENLA